MVKHNKNKLFMHLTIKHKYFNNFIALLLLTSIDLIIAPNLTATLSFSFSPPYLLKHPEVLIYSQG